MGKFLRNCSKKYKKNLIKKMFKTQENKNKNKAKLEIEKNKVKELIKKIEKNSPEKKEKSMRNKNSKSSVPKCVKVAGIVMNISLPKMENKTNIFQRIEMDAKSTLATSHADSEPKEVMAMAIPITNLEQKTPPAVKKQEKDFASMFEENELEADMIKMTIQEEEKILRDERLRRVKELKKEDDEKYILEMMKLEKRIERKSLADALSKQAREKAAKDAHDQVPSAEEPKASKMKVLQEEKKKEKKGRKEKEGERTSDLQRSQCSAQPPNPGAKLPPGMEPWIGTKTEQKNVGTSLARGFKKVQDKYSISSTPCQTLAHPRTRGTSQPHAQCQPAWSWMPRDLNIEERNKDDRVCRLPDPWKRI